jgi:hypothetical protein
MRFAHFCLSLLACVTCLQLAEATDFHVYYLGGQSNMDGYGYVAELPRELNQPVPDVPIFQGNSTPDRMPVDGRGVWASLRPGHGVGFRSDGQQNVYSERFGVELTFARRLQELQPERRIAIIKYSRGGTSIAAEAAGQFGCWEPDFRDGEGAGQGINQYDHFLATIRHAMSARDIDGDGQDDRLIPAGIIWMQGESDAAYTVSIASQYRGNLKRLMDLIRAAFRTDDLPVVIGRISDSGQDASDGLQWDHGQIVRTAQEQFCNSDPFASLVLSTDSYGYSDPWHYDTAGYLDLGNKFADAVHALQAQDAAVNN